MSGKVINLLKENDEKLSIEICKKTLNVNGNVYSDEQIVRIRDFLYELAEIECRHFKDCQQQVNKIVTITRNDYETTESHLIHSSKYRRTG